MHFALNIKDKLNADVGFKKSLMGRVTSCGVEYSVYRGSNGFYIFIALKDVEEERKIHINLDVLCSAIKKSFLTDNLSPLNITEENILRICEEAEIREKNIEFSSFIGKGQAETSFDVDLAPNETYLITVK